MDLEFFVSLVTFCSKIALCNDRCIVVHGDEDPKCRALSEDPTLHLPNHRIQNKSRVSRIKGRQYATGIAAAFTRQTRHDPGRKVPRAADAPVPRVSPGGLVTLAGGLRQRSSQRLLKDGAHGEAIIFDTFGHL